MSRKSNRELCDEFRELLTEGAKRAFASEGGGPVVDIEQERLLHKTKPWRGELWRAFAEVERRLCPEPPAPPPDKLLDRGA